MKRNLLVGQSGGPTAAINASLAGVISKGLENSEFGKVLGTVNGIDGVLSSNFVDLGCFKDQNRLNILRQTPAAYLGSCRCQLPEDGEIYKTIFKVLKKRNIGAFIYIGGNDSMDTVNKLSNYARSNNIDICFIGVPKTIDNDLVLTDHTPGFPSAAKFVSNSIRQLALDADVYAMKSVIVAEIMGRNAGWLAASSVIANDDIFAPVDVVCLPEVPFKVRDFIDRTSDIISNKKTTVIAVSEGICNSAGEYVTAGITARGRNDGFKHVALGGVGKYIESIINTNLGVKTRTIEFSTLQRCASTCLSLCDINEAFEQGQYGVNLACGGVNGVMVGIQREDISGYKPYITSFDVSKVANFEKLMPASFIGEDGFSVTDGFIKYAAPLVKGEPEILYKNGVIQVETRNAHKQWRI